MQGVGTGTWALGKTNAMFMCVFLVGGRLKGWREVGVSLCFPYGIVLNNTLGTLPGPFVGRHAGTLMGAYFTYSYLTYLRLVGWLVAGCNGSYYVLTMSG